MSVNWAEVVDGTWPAAEYPKVGPVQLRLGQGGGSRVSAASVTGPVTEDEVTAAEAAMTEMGQKRIFCLRPGNEALDGRLARRGYDILDPVNIYACPVQQLTDLPIPPVTVFPMWEPLAIMRDIWADAGIGPERIAIMNRVTGSKTGLLLRHRDTPCGTAFVAVYGAVAMIHALEILPDHRRNGLGQWAMRAAAIWASEKGAQTLGVICTKANAGANGLYGSLGMEIVGEYHYRHLVQGERP